MRVRPDFKVELAEGRRMIIVADPDSITVTGPSHVLDTMNGIPTKHRIFRRMDENFKSRVPLECPDYLQTTQKRVTVEVTITGKSSSLFGLKEGKAK
jgi:hypothetical protein